MTSTIIEARTQILVVTIEHDVWRLADMAQVLRSIDIIYGNCWRLNIALDSVYRRGTPSPAMDPVPKSAPTLRVQLVWQGSFVLHLTEDQSALAAAGGALVGGGALWLVLRVIRRGPKVIAEFVADLTTIPEMFAARRTEARAELYQAQSREVEARLDLMDARIREWYASEGAEALWTEYQRLVNAAGGSIGAKMLDENGEELPEPHTP